MTDRMDDMRNERQGYVPAMRNGAPDIYRDEFRQTYRNQRYERASKAEKNPFKKEKNYRKYGSEDEVYETIIDHLTKGVKFHDLMMDLYGFLGLEGFKKMHEYHYYHESINRRKTKCYVLTHLQLLVPDKCDDEGLQFIPSTWYGYKRHDVPSEQRKQYVGPSVMGYKAWEEETKELLEFCANELMDMGKMAELNEVLEMIEDVEKELRKIEEMDLKLKSVDYDMQYIQEMQDRICEEYEKKLEECFDEKVEEDKKKKRYKMTYGDDEMYQRRSRRTGRYIRG